jgi:hypothetical protein
LSIEATISTSPITAAVNAGGTVTASVTSSTAAVSGISGGAGPKGDTGATGAAGAKGDTGATGAAGTTSWNGLTDKPSTFTPSTHVHAAADITSGTLDSARLPAATTSVAGAVIVGTGLAVSSGTISANVTAVAGRTGSVSISSADVSGLATSATTDATNASNISTGTLSASRLPSTAVTAGSYGSASAVATFTVDAAGRLTAASSSTIAIASSAVSGLASIATSGSASDLGAGTVPIARIPTGTTSSTVCIGNDSRLSDLRTPTAHNQDWSTITSTPTTLSGYGITDAAASSHTHGNITNAGAIGSEADRIAVTTTSGVLTTATIGSGLSLSGGTLTASGGGAADPDIDPFLLMGA